MKVKSLIDLTKEPEECPVCGEQTLFRCGEVSKCSSMYCQDEADDDYGLP